MGLRLGRKSSFSYRTNEAGHSEILRIDDNNEFTKIYETNLQEQAYVAGWDKNNEKMYLVSNKGDVNLRTLYLMDPNTLEIQKLESDPLNKVDFGSMFIDDNTREIIYTSYTYDKRKRLWKNKKWKKLFKKLQKRFKGKEIGFSSFTKDYKQMLISVGGDVFAYETYYFNADTGDLIYQYTSRPRLKEVEKYLAPMKSITYKSSDGLEIPAYLTIPYGMSQKNLPLVVLVHGGPKGSRDYWGYDPYVQMLANRGYAVLQPNFRASGGYGKDFLNAGDKEWGRLMQDDIT
ncbi:MAG TPA: S9 family peptidase, partial [Desulfobacterales bacterium]|nr:S9 family peptidase [Desulfobacterales bacterium]